MRKEKGAKKGSIRKDKESGLVYQMYSKQSSLGTRTDYSKQPVMRMQQSVQNSAQETEYVQNSFRVKHLTAELARKTSDIERLRNYVTQLEEGEKGLIQELTRQLSMKDHEITRLASLYANKEDENRKVSTAFETHILSQKEHAQRIKDLLVKKEEENSSQIERYRKELERKDAQLQSLRQGLMESSQSSSLKIPDTGIYTRQIEDLHKKIDDKENEIKKLERMLMGEQKASKAIQNKLMEQISEGSKQTEQLKVFLIDKERVIKNLQSEFEKADEVGSLGKQKGSSQNSLHSSKQAETLASQLEESDKHLRRIEKAYSEDQKLHKSVQARLREQIITMSGSMDELKSMLIEKEKLAQNLEAAFEKRLSAKEDEIRQLKTATSRKHETGIYLDVDKLKSELKVKEESTRLMAQDIAKLTEQGAMLRKRLEERQRIYVGSERAYEELISRLRDEHDSRVQSLVQTAAQKETALAAALEEERSKLRQEKTLLKEKEKQIEETLHTFAATSQQLLKLGQTGLTEESPEFMAMREQLEQQQDNLAEQKRDLDEKQMLLEKSNKQVTERETYIARKEDEIKQLLASTEQKIAELNEKEYAVETREKLLLKEQEALTRELEVLSNAGIEISKSKQYLKEKLEKVRGIAKPQKSAPKATARREETYFPQAVPQRPLPEPTEISGLQAETTVEEAPEEAPETSKFGGFGETSSATAEEEPSRQKPVTFPISKLKKAPAPVPVQTRPTQTKAPQQSISRGTQQISPEKQMAGAENELFTEMGGYSELDEIKSIVEVGLQHGDSMEQIKESLLSTGYSKQNVDKVLSSIKK